MWNPAARDPASSASEEEDEKKGEEEEATRFMFFDEIAAHVAPVLDDIFPESSGVRLIAEPGRYLVAASCTLLTNVIGLRNNIVDETQETMTPISDHKVAAALAAMTREDEDHLVQEQSIDDGFANDVMEELGEYAQLFARQNLVEQEVETYTYGRDCSTSESANLLGPPEEWLPENGDKPKQHHTAEGVASGIVADYLPEIAEEGAMQALAAAGEAVVAGVVIQSVADSAPLQDDFSYYVNDGVYGAFNNLMFDHAVVRPRPLRNMSLGAHHRKRSVSVSETDLGFPELSYDNDDTSGDEDARDDLYTSTIFGPTCDSIDVISRSVLLPKLSIGDWLYFNNMGA